MASSEAWTELVRAGYDHSRDGPNTLAFLEMLPEIDGLSGLDVGCGEGHNTRLLAKRSARMTGIGTSRTFIRHAKEAEDAHRLGIDYRLVEAGFLLERFDEPYPSDEAIRARTSLQDAQVVANFLHVRTRKPATTEG
jgi:2-polyprenyl-3-methyl-5-hydroxy-6-metoxy-1,4-benzoquinol methylase